MAGRATRGRRAHGAAFAHPAGSMQPAPDVHVSHWVTHCDVHALSLVTHAWVQAVSP